MSNLILKKIKAIKRKRKMQETPVAIYVRCDNLQMCGSSDNYDKEVERNLQKNENDLIRFCNSKGYNIINVYKDYSLSEWEGIYQISDGVIDMLKDSFKGKFTRIIFPSIYDIDSRLEVVSSVLEIITDNDITVETAQQGIMYKDFVIKTKAELINLKQKNRSGALKDDK
jgi:hypothetical protein